MWKICNASCFRHSTSVFFFNSGRLVQSQSPVRSTPNSTRWNVGETADNSVWRPGPDHDYRWIINALFIMWRVKHHLVLNIVIFKHLSGTLLGIEITGMRRICCKSLNMAIPCRYSSNICKISAHAHLTVYAQYTGWIPTPSPEGEKQALWHPRFVLILN